MNLQENIQRIKQMMGLNEVVNISDDSYISMNIKNQKVLIAFHLEPNQNIGMIIIP